MSIVIMTVVVGVAGGFGAAARFGLDTAIGRHATRFPAGTMIINVTGSALLGLLGGLTAGGLPEAMRQIAGTGFLGGYTTFSTACVEVVRLARDGRILAATGHALGMLIVGTALAAAGWTAGRML